MTNTTAAKPTPPHTAAADHLHDRLHDLLIELVAAHESLLIASGKHRDALRTADTDAMESAAARVNTICDDIARLDGQRRELTSALAPDHPDATLSFLASRLPAPHRDLSLELATKLRELIIRVRTEQRRLRAAADAMLSHVRGIAQQIQQGLNHAGTYGSAGRVDAGATVVTGLDMTS